MDFIQTLDSNYEKLKKKDIVNTLWLEMLHEKRTAEYVEELVEYSFHYPVDSDTYLIELNDKFTIMDKNELRTIDGHLKAYLITFLYYCTNRFSRTVPITTTALASKLYIRLIATPDIGKYFFESNMFKIQMFTIAKMAREPQITEKQMIKIMKLVRKYCLNEKLETNLLRIVINTYIVVMLSVAKDVIDDINNVSDLQKCCIFTVKDIIANETEGNRIRNIVDGLFKCLGKFSIIHHMECKLAGRSILKVFVRDVLQENIDEDQFQYILEAFCNTWGKEQFNGYQEAVIIMNVLKTEYYKELVRKMVLYTQSKNHKRFLINIMHLIVAIAEDLPPITANKFEVLYSCVMRNIIHHFMDPDEKIKNTAIETIAKLCSIKNNNLLNGIFAQIERTAKFININIVTLLLCINRIVDPRYGMSPRNQQLLIIVAKFISNSRKIDSEVIEKTLQAICKDCTPFSLKHSLPLLHELFCVLALKQEDQSAAAILKILFRCAMHQDATSMDYANHLFNSMLKPSVVDGITYDPKYYYNLFLTSEFEYEALFTKCQKHIRAEHIDKVISELNYDLPGGAVLLCCLLNFLNYKEISVVIEYFIDNFNAIATKETMGPLSVAVKKIMQNRSITQRDIPQLDCLHGLILESLFQQAYQVPCIKPAYDLLQEIRDVLRIEVHDAILEQLLTVTSDRAFRRLHRREIGDHSVIMYLNELCLLMKKLPSEHVTVLLEQYMDDPQKVREMRIHMPDVYIQMLTLFTTMAMMTKTKVPAVLGYLEDILYHKSQIIKITAFKLYYAICKEMTHEFEEVIKFVFKEIVVADPCLIRLCVSSIEELVFDDFIKLDAENFYKFVHALGSDELNIFMKEVLMKRFLLSNQNDITKYYVQSVMYIHMYSKLPDYPISEHFDEELVKMKMRLNNPKEILLFLFNSLPIKKKINILHEISGILSDITRGSCKFEDNFFPVLRDLLLTFRFMVTPTVESKVDKHYYDNMCKEIQQKIVKNDSKYQPQTYYSEYDQEIRKCTIALLKLLFFENQQISDNIQIVLFDSLMHWIDFVKDEIINYVHFEKGKDYENYFPKLLQYYNRNKGRFVTPDR